MFKILSGSEPVPAGAIPVCSDVVTVMLTFGFVFSMLFQKLSLVSHVGLYVTEE